MLSRDGFEMLRRKLEQTYQERVSGRRIKAIRVNSGHRWQPPLYIEVGQPCAHLTPDGPPELVMAIFESRSFLVCTPDHGIDRGAPHIFTRTDVRQVVDMEPADNITETPDE